MQKNDSRICKKTICSPGGCKTKACRRIFFLLAAFVMGTQLFAYSGMLAGEKKLLLVKTKWFDIIYPERCRESAEILFTRADGLYEEVTAQYGLTPAFRMPVVITPAVDDFNAFWTAVPYNHIAIYDTGDSGAGSLAVFSETLLSTFRHELTHAVTYNMKNSFWRGLDKVFGDCVAPGMLSVTTGMAEGATLTSESAGGEGRLNDEYARHYVKQAKIERQFPSYHDVSGSADVMPGGAPYYFNGAFHQWLQEKYGMAAYAEFWYRVVNGKNFTISGAFKNAYGIKLKAAWKQFENDYEVPELAANPVKAGLVQDFFEPSEQDYSQLNNAGSSYSSLTAGGGRLVWLDHFGGRVFAAADSEPTAAPGKIRELFSLRGISGVKLSNDGRFIAASYYSENAAQEKARVKIYDFENGSFYSVKEKGLKEASVVKKGSDWFLVAQKYLNQHYTIVVYQLLLGKNDRRITGIAPCSELTFEAEINPFAFTPLEDGSFAWLKKNRLSYSLYISSVEGRLLSQYAFPNGMAVHSLSYSGGEEAGEGSRTFYFSYAQKGTLPRLGKLVFNSEPSDEAGQTPSPELFLSSKDLSGGVFEPLYWKGRIVYIGEFFRQSRLLTMPEKTLSFPEGSRKKFGGGQQIVLEAAEDLELPESAEVPENPAAPKTPEHLEFPEDTTFPDLAENSRPYNPFPYLIHGILIPYADYQTDYLGPDAEKAATAQSFFLGATYITANPWTDGAADLYTLAGGWDLYSGTFGSSLTVNKGSSTSLLRSQTQLKSEFNKNGWKQSGINLALSSGFRLGNVSQIALSNTASAFLGKKEELFYSLSDVASVQFSTIRRAGPGRFENKGLALAVSYGRWYDASLTEPLLCYTDESALSAGIKACIPRLLPFESRYGYTCNLPLTVSFTLLPASSVYGHAFLGKKGERISPGKPVFDATAETTVFSMEIQKAIPWLTAFYLNDFSAVLGYAATGTAGIATKDGFQTANLGEYFPAITDGRGYYLDAVYVRANLEFTPNIGVFANSAYKMKLFGIYSYTLHTIKELKAEERINLSIGLDLNLP